MGDMADFVNDSTPDNGDECLICGGTGGFCNPGCPDDVVYGSDVDATDSDEEVAP